MCGMDCCYHCPMAKHVHLQEAEEGAQPAHVEELRVLASPKIQEKLYMEEKCIVPKELVETLAMDPELLSNSSISKDLDLLIRTLG